MKNLVLLLVIVASAFYVNAQTANAPIFNQVEKILNKAKGQKVMDLSGNYDKIGKQTFNYGLVSVETSGMGKYSSDWLSDYTNINWKSLTYYGGEARGNDKLIEFHIKLKEVCKQNYHVKEEVDKDSTKSNEIVLYFLEKDYDTIKKLFDEQWK